MLGAIAGDVIGSVHEFIGTKTMEFPLFDQRSRFTDDTVKAGYGLRFARWFRSGDREPFNSWGNGAAMRAPAIGYAFDS